MAMCILLRLLRGFCHGNWFPFATFPWVLPRQLVSFCNFFRGIAIAIAVILRRFRGFCHGSWMQLFRGLAMANDDFVQLSRGFAMAIGVLSRLFPWVLPWQLVSFCSFFVGFAMAVGVLLRGFCHGNLYPFAAFAWVLLLQLASFYDFSMGFAKAIWQTKKMQTAANWRR